MSVVLRFYSIYIMFVIIQHLCIGIERDKIRGPVHEAMYEQKSSTLGKSTNDIKIINKISLSYHYHIFGCSFGFDILPCSYDYNMNQNFDHIRKNIEKTQFILNNEVPYFFVFKGILKFLSKQTMVNIIQIIVIFYNNDITNIIRAIYTYYTDEIIEYKKFIELKNWMNKITIVWDYYKNEFEKMLFIAVYRIIFISLCSGICFAAYGGMFSAVYFVCVGIFIAICGRYVYGLKLVVLFAINSYVTIGLQTTALTLLQTIKKNQTTTHLWIIIFHFYLIQI
eukprot:358422_1